MIKGYYTKQHKTSSLKAFESAEPQAHFILKCELQKKSTNMWLKDSYKSIVSKRKRKNHK